MRNRFLPSPFSVVEKREVCVIYCAVVYVVALFLLVVDN